MNFGVCRITHPLGQEGTDPDAIITVDSDVRAPVGDVMRTVPGHSSCDLGHQPRVPVVRVVFRQALTSVARNERIITLRDFVLDIVASTQRLNTEDVIEVKALVTGDGCSYRSCWFVLCCVYAR